ncbi:HAMP domain-containing protein [bacterium]|nr:HAMP domain-containing protein [bacterium]
MAYKRRQYFIDKGFQLRYMLVIIIAMLCVSMVVGWTVYATVWTKLADPNFLELSQLFTYFEQANVTLIYRTLILIIFISIASIFVSHKIAGPVYRFSQNAKSIAEGDLSTKIHLRKGDELNELANVFNGMTDNLITLVKEDRQVAVEIKTMVKNIERDLENGKENSTDYIMCELKNITEKLETIGGQFKLASEEGDIKEDAI